MHPHTATVCYLRSLLPVVESAGCPATRFLQRLGIDGEILTDVDARIPKDVVAAAWEIAAELTRNESLGLLASLHAPPGTFPVLDHIAANLPTVGDALRSIARYCRLCDDELGMQYQTDAEGATVRLTFALTDRRYSRHWAEWFIGLILSRARSLSGKADLHPHRVHFQHKAPTDDSDLRRILGCQPAFSSSMTSIAFGSGDLALPIRGASLFLSRVITTHAERDLQRAGTDKPFSAHIRRCLTELLDRESPRLATLARQARCSARTLQARLKKEGTSYEKLLDDIRRELAIHYIDDDSIRLMEVSLLLQYSEPSPFLRAFRRWTGMTPLEYRRTNPATAGSSESVPGHPLPQTAVGGRR